MVNRLLNSFIFWASWIIIPVLMEILPSLGSVVILIKRRLFPPKDVNPGYFPEITIIVPVYNSAGTLSACIRSIHESSYPNDRINVYLVNNQSKDNSFRVYTECQKEYEDLHLNWMNAEQGKSRALNLALYNSGGKYIIHIDSDGFLEKDALKNLVIRFENDLSVNVMTGAVLTDPKLIEQYPAGFSRFFRKLEFVEYAQAFLAGRNYASDMDAIYTLSGAFSAFRKSAVLKSRMYSTDTICEDTQITFQMKYLQKEKVRISERSLFFVDPIEDFDKLYTQRQRWQRGSLEVSKMFLEERMAPSKMLTDVNVRTLMYDHTFAFPRLIWYLALICLMAIGFSSGTILISLASIMVLYFFCGYLYYFSIIGFLKEFPELRKYYAKQWWVIPFLPIYNFLVFFIRFAGVINSIGTDSAWKTKTLSDEAEEFQDTLRADHKKFFRKLERIRAYVNMEEKELKEAEEAWYGEDPDQIENTGIRRKEGKENRRAGKRGGKDQSAGDSAEGKQSAGDRDQGKQSAKDRGNRKQPETKRKTGRKVRIRKKASA